MPSETNCTYFGLVYAEINSQVIIAEFNPAGTGTLGHTELNLEVTPATSTFNGNISIGSNTFTYNYSGNIATFSGRPSANRTMNVANKNIVSRSQLLNNINSNQKLLIN